MLFTPQDHPARDLQDTFYLERPASIHIDDEALVDTIRSIHENGGDTGSTGWGGDNGDPDNFLTPLLSCEAAKNGENYARWCSKDFEDLITRARNITEPAERAALYEQAQVIFHQDQPWINVVHPMLFAAMRKNVEGYTLSPLTNNNFATTQVK